MDTPHILIELSFEHDISLFMFSFNSQRQLISSLWAFSLRMSIFHVLLIKFNEHTEIEPSLLPVEILPSFNSITEQTISE